MRDAWKPLSLDELVARIEAIRLEEAPETCPACGSTTRPTIRRCSKCQQMKDLHTGFNRDRRKPLGYRYICKACKSERYDRPAKRTRRLRRIVERAALLRAS